MSDPDAFMAGQVKCTCGEPIRFDIELWRWLHWLPQADTHYPPLPSKERTLEARDAPNTAGS